jgi:hypothetical protein
MGTPVKASDFNKDLLTVGKFWKNPAVGPSSLYINYGPSKKNLRLIQSGARVAFGPQKYPSISTDIDTSNPKKEQEMAVYQALKDFAIDTIYSVRDKPEYAFMKAAGKSREVIANMFSENPKPAKPAKEGGVVYPPTFNVKLTKKKGTEENEFTLYDNQKPAPQVITLPVEEVINRGAEVSMVSECKSLWLKANEFGYKWTLHQARILVSANPVAVEGCILDDDDEVSAPAAKGGAGGPSPAAPPAAVAPPAAAVTAVADEEDDTVPPGDEEEDDEEEEVIQPPPPPPTKKKALAKKPAAGK